MLSVSGIRGGARVDETAGHYLGRIGFASLRPSFCCSSCCSPAFLCCALPPAHVSTRTATKAILAGMLGVSAMAVQNALVQISLKAAPSTAVMTTNITRFMMDVGDVMLGPQTS